MAYRGTSAEELTRQTGTINVPEAVREEQPAFALFGREGNWVFLTADRIWIPVFFALSSAVLRPKSTFAKKKRDDSG